MSKQHVVISDLHIPYQDRLAVRLLKTFLKEQQPHAIHILGDLVDFYAISRFDRDPVRATGLQTELDGARAFLAAIRRICPEARIILSEGNHEYRLRRYLWRQAPELSTLRCLALPGLLRLSELDIGYRPHNAPYRIASLLLTHGQLVRKWSGYSARGHFEKYGCCVLTGHSHRLASFYHRELGDTFGAWENGCLCTLDPEYAIAPDWQHGWSVVWTSGDVYFHVEQAIIVKGRYNYHGRMYGRRSGQTRKVEQLA